MWIRPRIFQPARFYCKFPYKWDDPGPMFVVEKGMRVFLNEQGPQDKHFSCDGIRTLAIAANTIRNNQIIAVPTDTVYGLACLASNSYMVDQLREITNKKNEPICISIGSQREISRWARIDSFQEQIISDKLPSPLTVVLPKKQNFLMNYNDGFDTVGIRVPRSKFLQHLSMRLGPLALVPAKSIEDKYTVYPEEFEHLWEKIGAIFYDPQFLIYMRRREPSTVIEFHDNMTFKVLREGVAFSDYRDAFCYVGWSPVD